MKLDTAAIGILAAVSFIAAILTVAPTSSLAGSEAKLRSVASARH